MKSQTILNHTLNRVTLLKFISPVTPYLAVALGLYAIGNSWITLALYHAGLFCFILLAGQKRIFREIFSGWNWIAGIIAIIICSMIGPLLCLIWPIISLVPEGLSSQLGALGLGGASRIIFLFVFIAVNPLLEEVYWRGFLKGKGAGRKKLPWVVDIVFAGYHLPVLAFFIKPAWLIFAFVVIWIGGWAWRWLSCKFGGIAIPLISHIVADFSIAIAVQIIAN